MTFSPAWGMAAALIYSFLAAFSAQVYWFYGVFPLFLLFLCIRDIKGIMLRLLKLNLFIVFVSLSVYLSGGTGDALVIFFRANLIMLVNIALFYRFRPEDFYYGFHRLRFPDKFTALLFFSIKYIDILGREYMKIRESLTVRGFSPGTDIFTYRTLSYAAGMLFVRSMDRAVKLSDTLRLRRFEGRLYPFVFRRAGAADYSVFAVLMLQALVFIKEMM